MTATGAVAQTSDVGFYRTTYLARTALNGMCLDASGGRMQPGDTLIIWSCHGGVNQRFYPVPADTNVAVFYNVLFSLHPIEPPLSGYSN